MSHQRTVYVVDGDLGTRRALTSHLALLGAEAWPFASGSEFLGMIEHVMPALILLDMDMAEPSGVEVLAELALRECRWPVIALSAAQDLPLAVKAMKLGALDFLEKPVDGAALAEALQPAWAGLERSLEADETRRTAQERIARLTPRELDIALALFAGRSNKGVAHELGISVRTVEMHRAHIMAKLAVKSLAEAAVLATQAGLASLPRARPPRTVEPPVAAWAARRFATR
ncbi:MAG: two-component system, LuxR family, response regulator FixJ [Sphingomonadales bacterium]|jgi:two-component system response regulator FixJ|nr:two-component system, LuxR family, response regulator FixJ [Sphingomonadales bacterium]